MSEFDDMDADEYQRLMAYETVKYFEQTGEMPSWIGDQS